FGSGSTHRFYLRLQVTTTASMQEITAALGPVVERFGIEHRLDVVGRPIRTLVLGSTAKHCLNDLLFQIDAGHLPIEVPLILANHPTLEPLARFHEIPFEHLPTKGDGAKAAFEERV